MGEKVDLHWHAPSITREDRERAAGHSGCVVWFTGLSGCGKSTIANLVDRMLHERGVRSYVLDGDNVRMGLNAAPAILEERHGGEFARRFGLTFAPQDREENIRRIGAVAALFADAGIVTLAAFVSPYRRDRELVRQQLRDGDFVEVHVNAPLSVCEGRDPKGLYRKARAGQLTGFTGIDAPYEEPLDPEIMVDSAAKPADDLAREVIAWLERAGKLPLTSGCR